MAEVLVQPTTPVTVQSATTVTVKPRKPFYKSVTLWGAATALVGAIELIMADPTLLQPFVTLGLLDAASAMRIAAVLAAAGPMIAAYGRTRTNGGAPLAVGPDKPPPPPPVVFPPEPPVTVTVA